KLGGAALEVADQEKVPARIGDGEDDADGVQLRGVLARVAAEFETPASGEDLGACTFAAGSAPPGPGATLVSLARAIAGAAGAAGAAFADPVAAVRIAGVGGRDFHRLIDGILGF